MAATMTYDSLIQDISEYTERDDQEFLDQIPRFILLAENKIAAAVKTLWETVVVNTTIPINGSSLAKPVRWRKTLSIKVESNGNSTTVPGAPIYLRDQNFVSLYQNEAEAGRPEYYADWDYENWIFAPVADREYQVQISYIAKVRPLDENNQVNLITTECPQLLLYATMVEACSYLKAFDKLQIWQPMYQSELANLTAEDEQRFIDKNSKIIQGQR